MDDGRNKCLINNGLNKRWMNRMDETRTTVNNGWKEE